MCLLNLAHFKKIVPSIDGVKLGSLRSAKDGKQDSPQSFTNNHEAKSAEIRDGTDFETTWPGIKSFRFVKITANKTRRGS